MNGKIMLLLSAFHHSYLNVGAMCSVTCTCLFPFLSFCRRFIFIIYGKAKIIGELIFFPSVVAAAAA